jgi:hypothetical protein
MPSSSCRTRPREDKGTQITLRTHLHGASVPAHNNGHVWLTPRFL